MEMNLGSRKHPDASKKARRAAFKDARVKFKRKSAEERQAAWGSLSVAEQLAHLDRRLGEGVGAVRQRARLTAALAAQATVVETPSNVNDPDTRTTKKAARSTKKSKTS